LRALNLNQTRVADLKGLAELRQLRVVGLHQTRVTDAGLKELAGLKRLRSLDLDGTDVTDAGLKELAGLKQLHRVSLPRQVTDAAIRGLQQALPQATISAGRPPYGM
jgi:hypothetical protein